MITSKYDWKQIEVEPESGFFEICKKNKLTPTVGKILYNRCIDSEDKLKEFLTADLSSLYDPYLLNDMEKAVGRIRQAIENYEQILIYGDYDADGMTSSAIMKETLEMMGRSSSISS